MQFLFKFGILQKTLNHLRIPQLLFSNSYNNAALLACKSNTLPLHGSMLLTHDTMKLKSINFSTSTKKDAALASLKTKIYNFMSSSTKAKMGACLAYEKCADTIDYSLFFKHFDLSDSFQSWFLILQLHVWMCTLIVVSEKSGLVFRTHLIDSMWVDVETRLGQLKEVPRSHRKKFLQDIVEQFRASQISYDEGVLCDDAVLAAAVWRTIFSFRDIDPRLLETMVVYIRKQIDHLDSQNSEDFLFRGAVQFLPLKTIIDKMNTV